MEQVRPEAAAGVVARDQVIAGIAEIGDKRIHERWNSLETDTVFGVAFSRIGGHIGSAGHHSLALGMNQILLVHKATRR